MLNILPTATYIPPTPPPAATAATAEQQQPIPSAIHPPDLPQVKPITTAAADSAAPAGAGGAGGVGGVGVGAPNNHAPYNGPGASPMALSTSSPFHAQSHIGAFPGAAGVAAGGGGGSKKVSFAQLQNDIIYGLINAIVGIPTMISFAAIVYQVRRCSGGWGGS